MIMYTKMKSSYHISIVMIMYIVYLCSAIMIMLPYL